MSIGNNIGIPIFIVNRNSDTNIANNYVMSIGERVRKARKEKELTQDQLASKVGVRQSTISELEKGDSTSTTYIASIAAALGVSALWLETGKGPQHVTPESIQSGDSLHQAIQLLALFESATPAGRAFILDAANVAEKK